MHSNPYAIPQANPGPAPATQPASRLPLQMMAVALLCSLAGLLLKFATMWFSMEPDHLQGYLDNILHIVPFWFYALLVDACSALLLTRYFMQRHDLARFAHPGRLIALYVGLYFIALVLVGMLYSMLWGQLMPWLYEGSHGISPALLMQPLDFVYFLLATLLPLWLSLHLMRRTAQVDAGASLIGRGEVALAFGLCFAVIYTKLLALLPMAVINPYGMEWLHAASSAAGLVYGLIALGAAHGGLPPQLPRLAIGRLLASVLVCMAMWLVAAVVLCIVLALILYIGSERTALAVMLLFGLLLLALLWPLTRLSLRWIYRPTRV